MSSKYCPKEFPCEQCSKAFTTQQSLNKHSQKCIKPSKSDVNETAVIEQNSPVVEAESNSDAAHATENTLDDIVVTNLQETFRFITETRPDGTVIKRSEVIYHVTLGDGRMLQAQIINNAQLRSILNL